MEQLEFDFMKERSEPQKESQKEAECQPKAKS